MTARAREGCVCLDGAGGGGAAGNHSNQAPPVEVVQDRRYQLVFWHDMHSHGMVEAICRKWHVMPSLAGTLWSASHRLVLCCGLPAWRRLWLHGLPLPPPPGPGVCAECHHRPERRHPGRRPGARCACAGRAVHQGKGIPSARSESHDDAIHILRVALRPVACACMCEGTAGWLTHTRLAARGGH